MYPHQNIIQFLDALKGEGFSIGIDSHLQVWKILQSLPENSDAETLSDYLSPLFCTNEAEQSQFKTLFSKYYPLLEIEDSLSIKKDNPVKIEEPQPTRPNLKKHLLWGTLISVALAALGIGLYQYLKPPPPVEGCMDATSLNYNSLAKIDNGTCQYPDIFYVCLDETMLNFVDTIGKSNPTTVYLPCNTCCYCAGCNDEKAINYNPKACENDGSCEYPKSSPPLDKARKDSTTYKVPFEKRPVDLPDLKPINNRWDYQLYQAKTPISIALYMLLIGLFIARLLYQRKRKSYNAARERGEEPPYTLPIKITNQQGILFEEQMGTMLRDMRGRESSNLEQLHLPKTIAATIKQGGFLNAQYKFRTRPTEYLILIDKNTDQNHQSQLFEHIYQLIHQEEVHATRFFFDDDPRICWNDEYPSGITIERLRHLYDNARLMVFSDGHSFINPTNNQTAKWTEALKHWKRRVLMTPQPMADWSYREGILAQFFMVLPSGIEGLTQVVEHFETLKESDLRAWKYDIGKHDEPIKIDENNLFESLQTHFDKDMMRWIIACAVYPELHWDLTMRIGHELSEEKTLVTHKNLIQLTRLTWFQRGYMPNDIRQTLLEYGDFSDEDRQKIRAVIVLILEENIPTNPKSYAYDEHQMHLAINHLLLSKVGEDKKKWLEIYQEQYEKGVKEDFIAIQELKKKQNNFLGFKLPENFVASIFKDGRAFLGVKNWWILGSLLAGLLMVLAFQFGWQEKCFDTSKKLGENLFCLKSSQDTVDFATLSIIYNIDQWMGGKSTINDSINWKSAFWSVHSSGEQDYISVDADDTATINNLASEAKFSEINELLVNFYRPIVTHFYNQVVEKYNKNEYEQIKINHSVLSVIDSFSLTDEFNLTVQRYFDILQMNSLADFYLQKYEPQNNLLTLLDRYTNRTRERYYQQSIPNLYHFLQYDFVDSMVDNRVRVRKNGKYGFLDSLGLPTWQRENPPYDYALNYNDGKSIITNGTEQCIIDKNERQIGACFTKLISIQDPSSKRWGYQNERGIWIILPQYEIARRFYEEYAVVKNNNKFGLIKEDNQVIIPLEYDEFNNFSSPSKMALVRRGNKYGYISTDLKIIEPLYQIAEPFDREIEGQAKVIKDGKTFFIDINGNCVSGCEETQNEIDSIDLQSPLFTEWYVANQAILTQLTSSISRIKRTFSEIDIKLTVIGTADGAKIHVGIPYLGEFGDINQEYYEYSASDISPLAKNTNLTKNSRILNNSTLAFLRGYGVYYTIKDFFLLDNVKFEALTYAERIGNSSRTVRIKLSFEENVSITFDIRDASYKNLIEEIINAYYTQAIIERSEGNTKKLEAYKKILNSLLPSGDTRLKTINSPTNTVSTPKNVVASDGVSSSIMVDWQKNNSNDRYLVYRGLTSKIEAMKLISPKNGLVSPGYVDKDNLKPEILYYYRVIAINKEGKKSSWSNYNSGFIKSFEGNNDCDGSEGILTVKNNSSKTIQVKVFLSKENVSDINIGTFSVKPKSSVPLNIQGNVEYRVYVGGDFKTETIKPCEKKIIAFPW